jgi:DNA-binding PadR family transcriptional regulator
VNGGLEMSWQEAFERLTEETLVQSNWFPLHRGLLMKLGIQKAMMIHYLLDVLKRIRINKANEDRLEGGWFYCSVKRIESETKINPYFQTSILKELEKDGFITFRKKGLPARRYVKINSVKVGETIHDWAKEQDEQESSDKASRSLETKLVGDISNIRVSKNSERDVRTSCDAKSEGDDHSSNEKTTNTRKVNKSPFEAEDLVLAKRLKSMYILNDCRFGKVRAENLLPDNLAKNIHRLRTKDSIGEGRIRKLIRWLRNPENFSWTFTPRLYTTSSFFMKFTRIEDAMKRKMEETGEGLSLEQKNIRDGNEYLNYRYDDPIRKVHPS